MLFCYSDKLSAYPGEAVGLCISSAHPTCELEVSRLGRKREVVHRERLDGLKPRDIPADASSHGCNWPISAKFNIGSDWRSGYYDIQIRDQDGAVTHHFICVKPARHSRRARVVLVLATNTYQAYNSWGGYNAYCNVAAVMEGRLSWEEATRQGSGILSRNRPFSAGIGYSPPAPERLINGGIRAFQAPPRMVHREFYNNLGLIPYDGAAGFVNKWEHIFAAWAEEMCLDIDYVTDQDLDEEEEILDGYKVAAVVGHSEYWSGRQRYRMDSFVEGGGNLAVFSGNTCFWKVRWDNGSTFVCHKHKGFTAEPQAGNETTHLWSHPFFNHPEASLTGLTFLFGGYHRFGFCVARGSSAYTVYDDAHWALAGSDLLYGDQFGGDVPLVGYENDGCLLRFDEFDGKLKSVSRLGVPADLEIIAIAPAAYGEDVSRDNPRIVLAEDEDLASEIAFGEASDVTRRRLVRGHAVVATSRYGKGEVFNGGTTEWAHGLAARNVYVCTITENVLRRFGAWEPNLGS